MSYVNISFYPSSLSPLTLLKTIKSHGLVRLLNVKCGSWLFVIIEPFIPSSSLVFLKTHPLSFIFMDIYLFLYLCINRNELYKNIPSIIKTDLLHFLNDVLVFFFHDTDINLFIHFLSCAYIYYKEMDCRRLYTKYRI